MLWTPAGGHGMGRPAVAQVGGDCQADREQTLAWGQSGSAAGGHMHSSLSHLL